MDGHGIITPREPLPLGKIYARATDGAETPNSIDSDHVPVTDTIPPTVPTVDTDLTGKATTLTPITVTTDPNTRVDLIDKMGILSVLAQQTEMVMSSLLLQLQLSKVMSLLKLMTLLTTFQRLHLEKRRILHHQLNLELLHL